MTRITPDAADSASRNQLPMGNGDFSSRGRKFREPSAASPSALYNRLESRFFKRRARRVRRLRIRIRPDLYVIKLVGARWNYDRRKFFLLKLLRSVAPSSSRTLATKLIPAESAGHSLRLAEASRCSLACSAQAWFHGRRRFARHRNSRRGIFCRRGRRLLQRNSFRQRR